MLYTYTFTGLTKTCVNLILKWKQSQLKVLKQFLMFQNYGVSNHFSRVREYHKTVLNGVQVNGHKILPFPRVTISVFHKRLSIKQEMIKESPFLPSLVKMRSFIQSCLMGYKSLAKSSMVPMFSLFSPTNQTALRVGSWQRNIGKKLIKIINQNKLVEKCFWSSPKEIEVIMWHDWRHKHFVTSSILQTWKRWGTRCGTGNH